MLAKLVADQLRKMADDMEQKAFDPCGGKRLVDVLAQLDLLCKKADVTMNISKGGWRRSEPGWNFNWSIEDEGGNTHRGETLAAAWEELKKAQNPPTVENILVSAEEALSVQEFAPAF